jgi:hypothetical protein
MTMSKKEWALRNTVNGTFVVFTDFGDVIGISTVDPTCTTVLSFQRMTREQARQEWLALRNWNGSVPCKVPC